GIWKVRPMPRLIMRCGAVPAISTPSNSIEPAVGTSVPDSMLKIVLLPEPFGPIRPRISPCSTRNETLLTAVKPPKRFTNPFNVSTPDPPPSPRPIFWLLNVVPFGKGSTASRCAWLFGHTTYDLSSTYWITTGNERSFCPAIGVAFPDKLDAEAQL